MRRPWWPEVLRQGLRWATHRDLPARNTHMSNGDKHEDVRRCPAFPEHIMPIWVRLPCQHWRLRVSCDAVGSTSPVVGESWSSDLWRHSSLKKVRFAQPARRFRKQKKTEVYQTEMIPPFFVSVTLYLIIRDSSLSKVQNLSWLPFSSIVFVSPLLPTQAKHAGHAQRKVSSKVLERPQFQFIRLWACVMTVWDLMLTK